MIIFGIYPLVDITDSIPFISSRFLPFRGIFIRKIERFATEQLFYIHTMRIIYKPIEKRKKPTRFLLRIGPFTFFSLAIGLFFQPNQ